MPNTPDGNARQMCKSTPTIGHHLDWLFVVHSNLPLAVQSALDDDQCRRLTPSRYDVVQL